MPEREDADEADERQLSAEELKELLAFAVKAPRRHKTLAIVVLTFCTVMGFVVSRSAFKNYRTEASILVQRNVPIQGIADPGRTDHQDQESPFGMVEQMLKRDSLLEMVRDGHLAEKGPEAHSTLGRIKADLKSFFGISSDPPPNSKAELEDGLAAVLSNQLSVTTDGTTLTIDADWWNEETSYDLVVLAVQHFFRSRSALEISPITDAIALLEDHAATVRQEIDESIKEFEQARKGGAKGGGAETTAAPSLPRPAASRTTSRPAAKAELDPELDRNLDDKRRQIREMEDDRSRRLIDLKSQLAHQLAIYTPAHPAIVALQTQIDALAQESPALIQLKKEERQLLDQVASRKLEGLAASGAGGAVSGEPSLRAPAAPVRDDPRLATAESISLNDPTTGLALTRLQSRIHKYGDLMDRIAAANLGLDAAKATFKYRYSVFKPADVVTRPKRFMPALVCTFGLILGALLAMGASALVDLAKGRVLEPWQAKRFGVPLLGEITKR